MKIMHSALFHSIRVELSLQANRNDDCCRPIIHIYLFCFMDEEAIDGLCDLLSLCKSPMMHHRCLLPCLLDLEIHWNCDLMPANGDWKGHKFLYLSSHLLATIPRYLEIRSIMRVEADSDVLFEAISDCQDSKIDNPRRSALRNPTVGISLQLICQNAS